MTMMIEKARLGRMNALSGLSSGKRTQPRNLTSIQQERVTFISSRARALGGSPVL